MFTLIKLALLVFTMLGEFLREQKIRRQMEAEDERRFDAALRKWDDADPGRVSDDDPDLFSD